MTGQGLPQIAMDRHQMAVACANLRTLRFVDRLAAMFNKAGIDLMVLKGAALLLTAYDHPHQRNMCDLDLLVRPDQIDRAMQLMTEHGCYRSQALVRDDFFPRFYYEAEFTAGAVCPLTIDLHVRPFRPLRYTRLVPDNLLWTGARSVRLGCGAMHLPSHENMLLHLAVHYAIHGGGDNKWARDVRRWIDRYGERIDWRTLIDTAKRYRLHWALRRGLELAGANQSVWLPDDVRRDLRRMPINWRDRLALAQAPHDNERPWRHVAVEAITTPGAMFVLRYLASAVMPDRRHMLQWYGRKHRGWLLTAHFLRWTRPLFNIWGRRPQPTT